MKWLIIALLCSCSRLPQRSIASQELGAENFFEVTWCLEDTNDNLKVFMPERFKVTYILPESYEVLVLTPSKQIIYTEITERTKWHTHQTQEISFKEAHLKMTRINCPKYYENKK